LKNPSNNLSPFNIKEAIYFPNFSIEEVESLFGIWEKHRNVSIDHSIISDIYDLTNGHRGFTCVLGKYLDEELRQFDMIPSGEVWEERTTTEKIIEIIYSYETMKKMIVNLNKNTPLAEKCRKLIGEKFIPFLTKRYLFDKEEIKLANHLTSEGCLISISDDCFEMASPIITSMIWNKVLIKERRNVPQQTVPYLTKGDYSHFRSFPDIKELLLIATKYIDKNVLRSALQYSFKKNRANGFTRDMPVPCEDVYIYEYHAILTSWILDRFKIVAQPNQSSFKNSKKKIDATYQ